jgi:hypothetical protein
MSACVIIQNNGQDINTVRDLIQFLGNDFFVTKQSDLVRRDMCLCCVDIEKTLEKHGIKWTHDDFGNYIIGGMC